MAGHTEVVGGADGSSESRVHSPGTKVVSCPVELLGGRGRPGTVESDVLLEAGDHVPTAPPPLLDAARR